MQKNNQPQTVATSGLPSHPHDTSKKRRRHRGFSKQRAALLVAGSTPKPIATAIGTKPLQKVYRKRSTLDHVWACESIASKSIYLLVQIARIRMKRKSIPITGIDFKTTLRSQSRQARSVSNTYLFVQLEATDRHVKHWHMEKAAAIFLEVLREHIPKIKSNETSNDYIVVKPWVYRNY